jgi:hypothetical protein
MFQQKFQAKVRGFRASVEDDDGKMLRSLSLQLTFAFDGEIAQGISDEAATVQTYLAQGDIGSTEIPLRGEGALIDISDGDNKLNLQCRVGKLKVRVPKKEDAEPVATLHLSVELDKEVIVWCAYHLEEVVDVEITKQQMELKA